MYHFQTQLIIGERHEKTLDAFFAPQYDISFATSIQQRQGIDRIFTRRCDGMKYTIQYKADSAAARTNNAFIEVVSVDNQKTLGWAYTCLSQIIIYYIPPLAIAYIIDTLFIKRMLPIWIKSYQQRKIPNSEYNAMGLLVPLTEFENRIIKINAEPRQ